MSAMLPSSRAHTSGPHQRLRVLMDAQRRLATQHLSFPTPSATKSRCVFIIAMSISYIQ